jgi:hypothetical protein
LVNLQLHGPVDDGGDDDDDDVYDDVMIVTILIMITVVMILFLHVPLPNEHRGIEGVLNASQIMRVSRINQLNRARTA